MRGLFFNFPNIAGTQYDPGAQPYSPGVSHQEWPGAVFHAIPWPRMVGTINALASHPGIPRMRAITPVVDRLSVFPANYLFLSGVVGKSQG